jgi:imidazolonepropionase-like amidohydrolase
MIAGASDAGLIVDRLARAGLPVLVGPPDEAPAEGGDETTRRSLPARLHAAGVPFALVSGDGAGAVRESLRLRAARAVAEGLPREAAIAAITTTPARILGLDDRYGLAVGRSADLVLYDGDPLAYATRVIAVIAAGEVVFEHADRRP